MKYFTIIFSLFLFSCSSNNDDTPNSDNPNIGDNPTTIDRDRYKISFQAESNYGVKHFKATYIFNNGTPFVVNYNGNVGASGFVTTNKIDQNISLDLEMLSGPCFLKNIKVKIEDTQTGELIYQDIKDNDYIIVPPDMLTEKVFLSNLYGTPLQAFRPQNNYKYQFGKYSSNSYARGYVNYNYKPEILVNIPTRGSIRVVIHTNGGYSLSIPNAWSIRDYKIGFCCNDWLSEVNVFNSSQARAYDFILPGHLSNINVNLQGYNKVSATIYLMRKNGTTQTIDVTSTNNNNILTNLTL